MSILSRAGILGAAAGLVAVVALTTPAQASQSLRDHADAQDFIIGAAVATGPLGSEAVYRDTLSREFNQVTAENAMKWDATEPNPGQFNFSGADQIVQFAQANGQSVHGHTMIWHSQTPGWVQNLNATEMRAAMENHISTVMGRYAGQIESWDVVNEAFNEDGSLRNSFWLQRLGPDYIADAFRMARAADPNALLCINDFNVEGVNAKSNAMFNLVRDLRAQGVPIDCVGFQGHLAIQFGFPNIQQNIQRFADLGVAVKITELDVRMQLPVTQSKLNTQADYYRDVFEACLNVDACLGVTIWGFTDRYSWVPDTFEGQGAALIYDENYNPKPAYDVIHDLLEAGDGGGNEDDTTPPTTPGTPTASNVTSNSAVLTWSPSTDTGGSGLAGYNIYREQGATDIQLTQSVGNTVTLTGLAPETQYQVYVRARDGAGLLSGLSPLGSFTTQEGDGNSGICGVGYSATNWGGSNGFTASVTVTNTGTAPINGWTLEFTLPAGQRITDGWSADWSQPQGSSTVTATNLSWNGDIPPGGSVGIGFNGTHTGSNPEPTVFTVNGSSCSTA